MPSKPKRSAGILAFRLGEGALEVLLIHPGGPLWAKKDAGSWSIPKGLYTEDEDALVAAKREFEEETGLKPVGDFIELGAGNMHSTVGLLDGAIKLAFERTDDQPAEPNPSLIRYVYSLVGAYYTSKDTPRNLLRAAERFEKIGRVEVSRYLEMRAREEAGHEQLALKDLSALGLPAQKIVANCKPSSMRPLCDLFDDYCVQEYPMDAIGFSYCSERIAAVKPKAEIDAVRSVLPSGVDATRFLRSHSSLGSEVSHVEETIEFVSELPASDRTRIVQATYRSEVLTAERRRLESIKSEAEICEELELAAGQELALSERQ